MSRDRERRLDPRVSNGVVRVEYVLPSPQVRDLSVSGMYLVDPRPLQKGQSVDLLLRLEEGEAIAVRGMVRRTDPGRGMAVEFIQIGSADRRRIRDFIARSGAGQAAPAGEDIFS
jgi:hypothetical protein